MGSRIWIFCSSDLLKWNIFIYYTCTPDAHVYMVWEEAKVVLWWELSPLTNVAQVQIPASKLYVGWVCCWFSPLPQEVCHRVLRFSSLLKKWTLPNSNSIWNARRRLNEFIRTPKCFVGKQISNYNLQGVCPTDLFFWLVLQSKLVRVSFKLTSIIWVIFVSESKLLRAKLPTARIASWQKHNLKALTVD